jgi:ATP-binding cassette subfamily G (WHITE) protein 2
MGPSGSGKSTLLNALALRLDPGMAVAGDVRLNGRPYGSLELKRASGYVMQVRGCFFGGGGRHDMCLAARWQHQGTGASTPPGTRRSGAASWHQRQASTNASDMLQPGCLQDDLLNAHLTVQETLAYTARLRCPPDYTPAQREEVSGGAGASENGCAWRVPASIFCLGAAAGNPAHATQLCAPQARHAVLLAPILLSLA